MLKNQRKDTYNSTSTMWAKGTNRQATLLYDGFV